MQTSLKENWLKYRLSMLQLRYITIGLVFLFTGCQSPSPLHESEKTDFYTLVKPGLTNIGTIVFNNPDYWSQQKKSGITSWTQDGILLNEIVFSQVQQGRNILGQKQNAAGDFDFNPGMSMALIAEQFTDALNANNHYNLVLLDRIQLSLNNADAIKFKISYDTSANVNYTAWALFIKFNDKLITVYCSAPSRYYFVRLEKNYLKILDSVRLI